MCLSSWGADHDWNEQWRGLPVQQKILQETLDGAET